MPPMANGYTMAEDDALVIFTPSGKRGRFSPGMTILDAARNLGVDLDSTCGGRAICGRCQISFLPGHHAKHGIVNRQDTLSPINAAEQGYCKNHDLKPNRRLACATRICKDVVIDVPEESQLHQQLIRKSAHLRPIRIEPVSRLFYVTIEQGALDDGLSDLDRFQNALLEQWQLQDVECNLAFLCALQSALAKGKGKITVALRQAPPYGKKGAFHAVAAWPGLHNALYGLAIDVGSTTIAMHLVRLRDGAILATEGRMNPQIRFGEDLMSRLSYAMLNNDGAEKMTKTVRETLAMMVQEICKTADIGPDHILECVIVGNPIMHHLLLGLDATPLGSAPFCLAVNRSVHIWASEIALPVHRGAQIYFLPCIAGHVGADAAGVLLSQTPYRASEITLIADIGTNAEIFLGNKDRLLAASSPTGPAFEGAQIEFGQRAAPGAIDHVRIDRKTGIARVRIIGCDLWSDAPQFPAAAGAIGAITGICGSGIIEAIGEMYLAGIISPDGMIQPNRPGRAEGMIQPNGRSFAYRLYAGPPQILITQNDIRAIQLAKAALYAGCRLLMDRLGVEKVDKIILAGAFGSHIDPIYAMVLGMIPDCDLVKVNSAGNAAGDGALIALVNASSRRQIETVTRLVEKVESAIAPKFQEHFIHAMAFPHQIDAFPHLLAAGYPIQSAPQQGKTAARRSQRNNNRRIARGKPGL